MARATCLLLPSTREGYGMVVIEAAAKGVPSVLVAAPDNASTEHITEGVNGFVAPDLSPQALADALVAAYERRAALRETTADWFAANAQELSVGASLRRVLEAYRTRMTPGAGRVAAAASHTLSRSMSRVRTTLRRVPAPLALLLAVAAVLSLSWNLATAPLQGPDEADHVGYVEHLAETGKIPSPSVGNGAYATDEVGRAGDRLPADVPEPPRPAAVDGRRRAPVPQPRGLAARQRAQERQRPQLGRQEPAALLPLRGARLEARVRRGLLRQALRRAPARRPACCWRWSRSRGWPPARCSRGDGSPRRSPPASSRCCRWPGS